MEYWKPHALATPHADQLDLRMGDKVRTIVEMHGVPAGTEGKVIRYVVDFPPEAAKSAGGSDNITVVLSEIE